MYPHTLCSDTDRLTKDTSQLSSLLIPVATIRLPILGAWPAYSMTAVRRNSGPRSDLAHAHSKAKDCEISHKSGRAHRPNDGNSSRAWGSGFMERPVVIWLYEIIPLRRKALLLRV